MAQFYFMSFDASFLISLGFTWRTGFTLTEGLKEEVEPPSGVPSAPGDDVAAAAPEPNLCTSLGVLGPGDRIGTTWDRGAERTSGSGRGLGTGARSPATAACGVFFSVSVSAAKLSALESEEEAGATYSSEVVDLLPTESVDGDLDFLGLGAGTGGLLARAPAGRSITRSGVWPGVLVLT